MFFKEHEKKIYRPPDLPNDHKGFDPLAVDRALRVFTKDKLSVFIELWKNDPNLGDISPDGRASRVVESAYAEEILANAARSAFGLPVFPDCTDGFALEWLCDYLEYMEGKGVRLENSSQLLEPSQDSSPESRLMPNSLDSTQTLNGSERTEQQRLLMDS